MLEIPCPLTAESLLFYESQLLRTASHPSPVTLNIPSNHKSKHIILIIAMSLLISGAKRCWRKDVKNVESSRGYTIEDCTASHLNGNYSTEYCATTQTSAATCRGGDNIFSTG
jgi:hypothetical protein